MDNKPNAGDAELGARIRLRRKDLCITQGDLAERLGVSLQFIHGFECGLERVGASRVQQLSEILDVPVMFFFRHASDDALKADEVAARFPFYEQDANALEAACSGIEDLHLRERIRTLAQSLRIRQIESDREC